MDSRTTLPEVLGGTRLTVNLDRRRSASNVDAADTASADGRAAPGTNAAGAGAGQARLAGRVLSWDGAAPADASPRSNTGSEKGSRGKRRGRNGRSAASDKGSEAATAVSGKDVDWSSPALSAPVWVVSSWADEGYADRPSGRADATVTLRALVSHADGSISIVTPESLVARLARPLPAADAEAHLLPRSMWPAEPEEGPEAAGHRVPARARASSAESASSVVSPEAAATARGQAATVRQAAAARARAEAALAVRGRAEQPPGQKPRPSGGRADADLAAADSAAMAPLLRPAATPPCPAESASVQAAAPWLSRPLLQLARPAGAEAGSRLALAAVAQGGTARGGTVVAGAVGSVVGVWRVPAMRPAPASQGAASAGDTAAEALPAPTLPVALAAEASLVGHGAPVSALALGPRIASRDTAAAGPAEPAEPAGAFRGEVVLSGDLRGGVCLWNASSGRVTAALSVVGGPALSSALRGGRRGRRSCSQDGAPLAAAASAHSLGAGGRLGGAGAARGPGPGAAVTAVAVSPRFFAAGSADGSVSVWQRRWQGRSEGAPALLVRHTGVHEDGPVMGMWPASDDTSSFISTGGSGSVRLWQASLSHPAGPVQEADSSRDAAAPVSAPALRGAASGRDLAEGDAPVSVVVTSVSGHSGRVTCASLNRYRAITGDTCGCIRVWGVGRSAGGLSRALYVDPPAAVTSLDASATGDVIAAGTADGRVLLATFPAPQAPAHRRPASLSDRQPAEPAAAARLLPRAALTPTQQVEADMLALAIEASLLEQ